ncbi:MAG: hypothetical protein AB1746_13605 [Candidatus Zixiibacteriota bacterium]
MNTPAAKREILVLLAGIVWSAVGLGLMTAAVGWLSGSGGRIAIVLAVGILVGTAIYHFGFSRLAMQNLTRIYAQSPGKDKVCVFAFQNKRSYFIVIIMMVMGYTLRHLPIEKIYLAPLYMAIGLGLFLSSLRYYWRLRH